MTTSTAFPAQGTSISIAGAPAATLNITAITKSASGSGAVCSCTTPPPVGTVMVFATATGMPEIVGRIGIVSAVAAGVSFTVNIDSSSFASAATTSTATPQTWVTMANAHDFSGFDGSASETDVTHLLSSAKEYIPGLEDFGQMSMNIDVDPSDPGQLAARAAKTSQVRTYFQVAYRNGKSRVWYGFVKKFSESGAVDAVVKASCDIRISGRPSFSEVAN